LRSLPPPAADHQSVFNRCVAETKSAADRNILVGLGAQVVAAGRNYINHANAQLHQIALMGWSENQKLLLESLYSDQLVGAGGAERNLYDTIRTSATRCPYCTFGEICEVDHFLPKKKFPEYAVLPANLLPICHLCNHTKRSKRPLSANAYLLHPYFDRLPAVTWLFAEMIFEAGGPVLKYRIELDPGIHGDIAHRLGYHFDVLRLGKRFRETSAVVLAEIEEMLTGHLGALAPNAIAHHFALEAIRKYKVHGNCIEAAAFRAASESDDYCAGNYRN
jgi:hypothetical protein